MVSCQVDRSQIWRSLIYHVKLGKMSPVAYIDMVMKFLGKEREQATVTKVLMAAAEIIELFISEEETNMNQNYYDFLVDMAARIEDPSLRGIVID